MCYRSLLLRRHLRFRPCNCCSSWRRTDPCNGRTGRFLRTILHSTDGNLKLHCHCHPAKYRLRCICLHHRHIHRRHVHGRYRTRSSNGRGTDNRSNAGSKETQYQTIQGKTSGKERWDAFKDAFWGFLMPVIILGGIYGGIFTPTEAAAVSVVYGLFVGMVIYREVSIRDMFDILVDSAKTTGGIMLIVASASLFSFVCTKFGIADAASNLLGSIAHNQFTFLLIVNIIFLIAGCFIDANSAMYIFIPIMLPVCKALGYDIVAFGVMATVNLAIGQVTPPVGVNLFVAISIKIKKGLEVTLQEISRAVVPMIAACVAVLLIVTYIPITSTFLPKALAKEGSYTGDQSSASSDTASKDAGDGNNSFDTIADYSDLDWPEMTWNFACSTTETSTC